MPKFNSILTAKSSISASGSLLKTSKSGLVSDRVTAAGSQIGYLINQPAPSFWLDNGMVWPISDFSVPWGAADYGSLLSWINAAQTIYGGPLNLMPANWYAGKPVTAMDMPIAYYPKALPHVYPFLVWAAPHVVPIWTQALNSLVSQLAGFENFWSFETYYGTQGPLISPGGLSDLLVSTPQGDKNAAIRYVGISPRVPPLGGNIFFGAA